MLDDLADIISRLKRLRLFAQLDKDQLERVARVTEVVELAEGQALPLPAKQDYPFYLVEDGELTRKTRQSNAQIETHLLKKEDFFGAEVMLTGRRHEYQIQALQPATLLKIESARLASLLRSLPPLKTSLREQLLIYRKLSRKIFNWVDEHETVYLIVRQHLAFLLVTLFLPVVLGWMALAVFFLSLYVDANPLRLGMEVLALLMGAAAGVWGLWLFVDWLNDYYIVTDLRVVWLERVIFIYDSRQEAPLSAVKSEEVSTSLVGRLLGYGDVITYAFMGKVVFRRIANPYAVCETISVLRKRSTSSQLDADRETKTDVLRNKLYPPVDMPAEAPEPAPLSAAARKTARRRPAVPVSTRFRQYFQTHVVEGSVITYRKHIFILLKKVWVPGSINLLILAITLYTFIQVTAGTWTNPSPLVLVLMALVLTFPFSLWWLYQYIDWRNDIYQITLDKIIDSEKKPLGTESTKSAPLENILSLDYERIGLLGILLNMGNVIINTGTDKLTWMTITNPARAQREIFNRMTEQRRNREREEAHKKWDEDAEWLAVYDRLKAEEGQRAKNSSPS